ncbi:iron complex transport system permease protein [Methylosinus sp. sav-2]|uniref:FecCD family ABC transporter permease n=1 Tax=Methylosinus sp. sav-2 TaxID=2485168 RepID=UPI00047E902E|nr:iron ABC transporter permease [Methylosinus sp. sav-2]TDX62547.1 iron complex transport system permease protein [Methylosinus sp. sav-2]
MRFWRAPPAADGEGRGLLLVSALALGALILASLALGRYPLSLGAVVETLIGRGNGSESDATAQTIIFMVRLPRIATAVMVGAGLSIAGAAYQTVFRNPMASPSLLGVSAGAGFGASLALLLHLPTIAVEAAAFVGGLAAVGASYLAASRVKSQSLITLVLCGMVMSALFQALISLVKYVADPVDTLATITFWLMGSLAKANGADAATAAAPVVLGGAVLFALRWRISLLALGDHEAAALGADVVRLRIIVILCATAMTAATVCVAGIVGWVGLLVPHIARMLFGMEPGRVMVATATLGALFVLGVDDVARSASIIEIPLGVMTAVIGAPFFLFLVIRARSEQWS